MKGYRFTKEQIEFIRPLWNDKTLEVKEMVKIFNNKFGDNEDYDSFYRKTHRILGNRRFYMPKEKIDFLKSFEDKKITYGEIAKLWNEKYGENRDKFYIRQIIRDYKIKHQTNLVKWSEVGSIYKINQSAVYITTENGSMLYKNYLWEQAHNDKVRKDECVTFLDGNVKNFEIENLLKVKRSALFTLNLSNIKPKNVLGKKAMLKVLDTLSLVKEMM